VPPLHLDPLLEPFSIKGLRLRNRVVSTSHEPAYGEDGLPTERYIAYHAEKARGGVGMTMFGGSAVVSIDSAPTFGNRDLINVLAGFVDTHHGLTAMIPSMGQASAPHLDSPPA
jgi:2,4-dienoyl-CoA reductase-like NADH-dependent reductase (Old Yellow Enzyme family)